MSVEVSPVQTGHRAGFLVMELAGLAVVAHAVDVGRTRHVGFGHHRRSQRKGPHPEHVGLHHPIVGIDERSVKPIRQLTGIHIEQVGDVAEHHEARNVMGPAVLHDRFNRRIEAAQPAGCAPICLRQRIGLREMIGMEFLVLRGKALPASASDTARSVNVQGPEPVRDVVDVAHILPPNHLANKALYAVERSLTGQGSIHHSSRHHPVQVHERRQT